MRALPFGLQNIIINRLALQFEEQYSREEKLLNVLENWKGFYEITYEGDTDAFTSHLVEILPSKQLQDVLLAPSIGYESEKEIRDEICATIDVTQELIIQIHVYLNQISQLIKFSLSLIKDEEFRGYEKNLTNFHAKSREYLHADITTAIRNTLQIANTLAQFVMENRRSDYEFSNAWYMFHDQIEKSINVIADESNLPLEE